MRKQANPRKRRTKRISGSTTATRHSSVPTGRAAYSETRRWLLERHGPVCGYCGGKYAAISITLDHVTPRRGQTAYDRRDNLVLACKRCNAAKADKPFLTYLLGQRMRAAHLLRYGSHLSVGILDIIRPLAAEYAHLMPVEPKPARIKYGTVDDEDSPYLESPYRASA